MRKCNFGMSPITLQDQNETRSKTHLDSGDGVSLNEVEVSLLDVEVKQAILNFLGERLDLGLYQFHIWGFNETIAMACCVDEGCMKPVHYLEKLGVQRTSLIKVDVVRKNQPESERESSE